MDAPNRLAGQGVPFAAMREEDIMSVIRNRGPLQDSRVILGPGDDLAMVRCKSGQNLLIGVDQVVDGLHVNADTMDWDRIGRKAVHRCLSDIAAMAGLPLASVVSVAVPTGATRLNIEALCVGLNAAADDWNTPLVGGDIAIHRTDEGPLTIAVTVVGTPHAVGAITRGGGRAGDLLIVTGNLGCSMLPDGTGHHLDFYPRIEEAIAAADTFGTRLHAMIDISDGLGRDAGRLAEASGLQAEINMNRLPRRGAATALDAMRDGEDYELLLAVAGDTEIPASFEGRGESCPLTIIGSLHASDEGSGQVNAVTADGQVLDGSAMGWDHG
ncbi:MAG: thiamine-monophosphate kinase [Planctomycetes bacterium]|nr:thiamine-monophosphate kinase [Planctomycetota bacterium]MCP4839496.1 thiamine-monophosphate kinase [Planctomycetota bacterium]